MNMQSFTTPIFVQNPDTGTVRTVKTVRDAKTVLGRSWPAYHGSQHRRAEAVCDAALEGKTASTEARRAFIAAAIEAHFHIQ